MAERRFIVHTPRDSEGQVTGDAVGWKMPTDEPLRADLVGLAFSGGGIRSATFNLGVLQALGRLKLLTRIDYLSSVSGGGYIHGWLAAWIRRVDERSPSRPGATPVEAVEGRLDPRANRLESVPAATEAEPETVHHLRAHSRYLAPRFGLFSLDAWTLVAIYLRNLFVTSLIVGPILLGVVVACRFVVAAFAGWPASRGDSAPSVALWSFFLFVVLTILAEGIVRFSFGRVFAESAVARDSQPVTEPRVSFGVVIWVALATALFALATLGIWLLSPAPWSSPSAPASRMPEDFRVVRIETAAAAGIETAAVGTWAEGQPPSPDPRTAVRWWEMPRVWWEMLRTWFLAIPDHYRGDYIRGGMLFGFLGVVGGVAGQYWRIGRPLRRIAYVVLTLVHGVAFGVLLTALVNNVFFFNGAKHPALFATVGPPLFLLALVVAGYVETAMAGGAFDKYQREWRSRLTAWFLLCAAGWAIVFATVVYVPWGLREAGHRAFGPAGRMAVPWGALAGWALTTGVGLFAARRTAAGSAGPSLRAIARVVPVVFLVGLVAAASELSLLIPNLENAPASPAGAVAGVGPTVRLEATGDPRHVAVQIDMGQPAEDPLRTTYLGWLEAADDPTCEWWRRVPFRLFVGVVAFAVLTVATIMFVSATRFSLHTLYMNRLTRAYLGASLKDRKPGRGKAGLDPERFRAANDFTGFDPQDDLPLAALRVRDLPEEWKEPYLGPYPIFNTTLNMVGGEELAYQDRKGTSFVLTPAYCGSESTGYAMHPKDDPMALRDLTVGRAIAVSGAAVDPNMKDFQSPQLTAFLTILNARLGWWVDNPLPDGRRRIDEAAAAVAGPSLPAALSALDVIDAAFTKVVSRPATREQQQLQQQLRAAKIAMKAAWECVGPQPAGVSPIDDATQAASVATGRTIAAITAAVPAWSASQPGMPWAGWPYLRELGGQTDASWDYVHLSDGGHFENTGAYELIRRRCRHVVVIDAAEDPADASENLANLIRLIRTDFGVSIDIDTSPVRKNADGVSRCHCAVGAIRYDEVDPSGVIGTLVFVRPSLTGDEEADLRNYAATNPPFPHHSTADQFFDDAQFESYRQLGFHVGMEALGGARQEVGEPLEAGTDAEYRAYTRRLFAALRRAWTPLPEGYADAYARSCRDYLKAAADLRDGGPTAAASGRGLRRVSRALFAEARNLPAPVRPGRDNSSHPAGVDTDEYYTDLHEVDSLLQLMELAWLENGLDRFGSHPQNRGWMNVLRRWSASGVLHRFWPVLRGQYSRGFVRFCAAALNLAELPVQWCRIANPNADPWERILTELGVEFQREWADALREIDDRDPDAQRKYLSEAVENSKVVAENGATRYAAWFVTTGRGGEKSGPVAETGWRATPDEAGRVRDSEFVPEYRPAHADGQSPEQFIPLGLVVAFKSKAAENDSEWELLVWMRGPYRSQGLGRSCLPWLLDDADAPTGLPRSGILHDLPPGVKKVFVRFPQLAGSAGDRHQRVSWSWFFNDHDFVSEFHDPREPDPPMTRLVRVIEKPSAKLTHQKPAGAGRKEALSDENRGPPADGGKVNAGAGTPCGTTP